MRITIIAIGKEKDFAAADLVREYSMRIEHYMPIEWKYIPGSTAAEEEKGVLRVIDPLGSSAHIVALDEVGKEFTSQKFANFMQSRLNESVKYLVFVIGGSYGLSAAIRGRVQTVMALSQLTFPHQLVRLILAEQIYRVCTILKGEKYHH